MSDESDNPGIWVNRREIKSESSNRKYVVSQHKVKRFWACSCPGFKSHRKCKHLQTLSLPCNEQPYEPPGAKDEKKGFLDGYATYDPHTEGYGTPEEWRKAFIDKVTPQDAAEVLQGHGAFSSSWASVSRVCGKVVASTVEVTLVEYENAARAVSKGSDKRLEENTAWLKEAKFKAELLTAYLEQQKERVENELRRVNAALVAALRG